MPPIVVPQTFALALQHHQAGRLAEAEALYRQILAAQPNHAEALHHLGLVALQTDRQDLSVKWIRQALVFNPNSPAAHSSLGEACRRAGRLDEAVAAYRRALELQPDSPEAHTALGNALADQGQHDKSMAAYRQALQLRPDYALAYYNLGLVLAEQGQWDEAIAAYRRALELQPGSPETHNNLGNALRERGQLNEAVAAYRQALQLQPDHALACYNLGTSLKDQGHLDEAVACFQRALALKPGFPEGHVNLGRTWWLKGDFHQAEAAYRHAIACRADFANAHLNLSILLLLLGRYEEGWHEYEWRWRAPAYMHRLRQFSAPPWDGRLAPGKMILIHAEQGFGDTLQFARYLPLVRAHSRAARVVLECHPALVPLLDPLRGADFDIVALGHTDATLPPFDLHLPLLSLPLALQRFAPVPMSAPYLHADSSLRAPWRERLDPGAALRVGVAWAGSPTHLDDHRRSIAPEKLAPLLRVPGIQFVSLQIEPHGPLPPTLAAAGVLDFTADIANFSDSAALLAELDLIISVDTAVAHLAGALGRPVWTLLPFVPDWRWGLESETTPWYSTMRLFRQPAAEDWDAVILRVIEDLSRATTERMATDD